MKELYTAPTATVVTLEAVEKLALLDERSNDGIGTVSDIPGVGDFSVLPNRPR